MLLLLALRAEAPARDALLPPIAALLALLTAFDFVTFHPPSPPTLAGTIDFLEAGGKECPGHFCWSAPSRCAQTPYM